MLPRALGLPRDPIAAARRIGEALATGHTRTISLGRVNGRRFTFAAGVGADAEFIRRMESRGRTRDGKLPGDITAASAAHSAVRANTVSPPLQIEGIGRAASAMILNGDVSTYFGRSPFASSPRRASSSGWTWPLRWSCALARCLRSPGAACAGRARRGVLYGHDLDRVTVFCDLPMPLQVDGEDLGDVREAHFVAERDAARVLV